MECTDLWTRIPEIEKTISYRRIGARFLSSPDGSSQFDDEHPHQIILSVTIDGDTQHIAIPDPAYDDIDAAGWVRISEASICRHIWSAIHDYHVDRTIDATRVAGSRWKLWEPK